MAKSNSENSENERSFGTARCTCNCERGRIKESSLGVGNVPLYQGKCPDEELNIGQNFNYTCESQINHCQSLISVLENRCSKLGAKLEPISDCSPKDCGKNLDTPPPSMPIYIRELFNANGRLKSLIEKVDDIIEHLRINVEDGEKG